jgi:predicted membrane channel-forming protein YqfA (hemolysin III family)
VPFSTLNSGAFPAGLIFNKLFMKKLSIFFIVAGLLLLILGNVLYGHHQNIVDSGGSSSINTLNGAWAVKIPAFFGGVLLIFGCLFYYVEIDTERIKRAAIH